MSEEEATAAGLSGGGGGGKEEGHGFVRLERIQENVGTVEFNNSDYQSSDIEYDINGNNEDDQTPIEETAVEGEAEVETEESVEGISSPTVVDEEPALRTSSESPGPDAEELDSEVVVEPEEPVDEEPDGG
jgi:hypothetical protein